MSEQEKNKKSLELQSSPGEGEGAHYKARNLGSESIEKDKKTKEDVVQKFI